MQLENHSARNRSDSTEVAYRKLFIGGLSYSTDEEKLRKYFKAYGTVQDAVVMKDPISKRSRGFGFITFTDVSGVDNTLSKEPHTIDSRKVEAKRAVPRSEISKLDSHTNTTSRTTPTNPQSIGNHAQGTSPPNKGTHGPQNGISPTKRTGTTGDSSAKGGNGQNYDSPTRVNHDDYAFNKIFVGGLHYDTKDGEFRTYFEKYGKVISAEVMFNRETHKSRGFGFIVFETEDSAVKVSAKDDHSIDDKLVEVKRAIPRSKLNPGSFNNPSVISSGIASSPSSSSSPMAYGSPIALMSATVSPNRPSQSKPSSQPSNNNNNNNNIRHDVRRAMSSSLPSSSPPGIHSSGGASTVKNSPMKNGSGAPPSIWKTLPSAGGPSTAASVPCPSLHWPIPGPSVSWPVPGPSNSSPRSGAGSSPSYAAALALGVGTVKGAGGGGGAFFADSTVTNVNTTSTANANPNRKSDANITMSSPAHGNNNNTSGNTTISIDSNNSSSPQLPRKRGGSFQIPLLPSPARPSTTSSSTTRGNSGLPLPLSPYLSPRDSDSNNVDDFMALNNLRHRASSEPNVFSHAYNTLNFMINSGTSLNKSNLSSTGTGSGSMGIGMAGSIGSTSRDSLVGFGLGFPSHLSSQSLVTLGGTDIHIPSMDAYGLPSSNFSSRANSIYESSSGNGGFNSSREYTFPAGLSSDGLDYSETLPESSSFLNGSPTLAGIDWLSSPLTNTLPDPSSPSTSRSSGSFAGDGLDFIGGFGPLPPQSNGSPGRGAVPTLDAWASIVAASTNKSFYNEFGGDSRSSSGGNSDEMYPSPSDSFLGPGTDKDRYLKTPAPSTSMAFMNTSTNTTTDVESRVDDGDMSFNTSADAISLTELNFNSPVFVPTKS